MMFVIMAYDIEKKRVGKVCKAAQKYLFPIQNSLFHGHLTESQLERLKKELYLLIDPETDKLVFYKSFNDNMLQIDQIGIIDDDEMIL